MNLHDISNLAAERVRKRFGADSPVPDFNWGELQIQTENVPDWWTPNGNTLYTAGGNRPINLQPHPGLPLPTNAVVVVGIDGIMPSEFLLWGNGALVSIDRGCELPAASINCGGESTIVLGECITCSHNPILNARNGGLIWVSEGGLWSTKVTMFTDDMHAIIDVETGKRVNPFGGHVRVERKVWLGYEVILLPGAEIGSDTVVGARATVNGVLPANSVCVGTPARAVRSGTRWSSMDIRPDNAPVRVEDA